VEHEREQCLALCSGEQRRALLLGQRPQQAREASARIDRAGPAAVLGDEQPALDDRGRALVRGVRREDLAERPCGITDAAIWRRNGASLTSFAAARPPIAARLVFTVAS